MKKYPTSNIYIDYEGIQSKSYVSKNRIKKAVYNCLYGGCIKYLVKYNVKVTVYWHYGWNEPVVYIPRYGDYIGLGKYLGWRY